MPIPVLHHIIEPKRRAMPGVGVVIMVGKRVCRPNTLQIKRRSDIGGDIGNAKRAAAGFGGEGKNFVLVVKMGAVDWIHGNRRSIKGRKQGRL